MERNLTQIIIILNSGSESGWVSFCKEKKTQKPKQVMKLDLGYESLAEGDCVGAMNRKHKRTFKQTNKQTKRH